MNRREQKRQLLRSLSVLLEGELSNGSGWVFEPGEEKWNESRAQDIIEELADEFRRRAGV